MTEDKEYAITPKVRLGTMDLSGPGEVIHRATEMAGALADIVNDRKLYSNISGKKYVRVEGWSTLGAMLGILPREVDVKELEDGSYEATVELIRASDGAVVGRASALCGIDEKTWGKRAKYARRSMSVTRATGKAYRLGFAWIMQLAGYEGTPAEEMDFTDGDYREQSQQSTSQQKSSGNGLTKVYQAVVKAGLSDNEHAAGNALRNYCQTGYNTVDKAVAWMRIYRGWRDAGLAPQEAADKANAGEKP